ncbi:hypothetical protein pEaSNUABM13_00022 [Erwinia phage pEa_SNUABM_13]|nr:hypothetical protein pEaSNUABM13_00022 [Erwinia phage pEa_SNUABM_13]QYW05035.1 hypothetical protein pEaSNUABM21_00021 [Erwinia phage pEa_SNUABM_21]
MHPVITDFLGPIVKRLGLFTAIFGFVGVLLSVIAVLVCRPEVLQYEYDTVNRLRTEGIVFLGKGVLIYIVGEILEGTFKWRKDD